MMRLSQCFLLASTVIFCAVVLGLAAGYRFNATPSLALGIYRISAVVPPLQPGDLVTFTLPVPLRLQRWLVGSFTKPVAGLPGDRVCMTDGRLLVAGEDYGPVYPDAPVHMFAEGTCLTVGKGEVFVASHTPRSYDSRYYGPVRLADVQRSTPVWTWKESR